MLLPRLLLPLLLTAPAIAQVSVGVPVWEQQFPDVVTDLARQRLTMVDVVGTTWEWDGSRWREMDRSLGFGTRRLVHDPVARRTLMLFDDGGTRQQFSWDGHSWQPMNVAAIPSLGPMVFDIVRNRAVMLEPGSNTLHEWDGVAWIARGTAPVLNDPSPRTVYDAARQEVVLLTRPNNTGSVETHVWDGVSWQQVAAAGPAGFGFASAYDSSRSRLVTHGGGLVGNSETWEWDGVQWTQAAPSPQFVRRLHTLAFDPVVGQVVAFGGVINFQESAQDAWAWNGVAWQQVVAGAAPLKRAAWGQAYDASRGRLVLFGGTVAALANTSELWEWDGIRWHEVLPIGGPGPRAFHAMSRNLAASGVLLFGGLDPTGLIGSDLWQWNGAAWVQLVAAGPPARLGPGMALDPGRSRIVLHGGTGANQTTLVDTWEWNGNQWTQRSVNGPGSSGSVRMAYDPNGGGMLLHQRNPPAANATWRWDGQSWTNVGAGVPAFVYGIGLDPSAGIVVANTNDPVTPGFIDTWGWNGSAWLLQPATNRPFLGRFDAGYDIRVAEDTARSRALIYTGTFLFARGGTFATADDIGPACTDPAVETPFVSSFGMPRLGDGGHALDLHAGPQRVGVLGFALAANTLSFGPGCDWQVGGGPTLLAFTGADGNGAQPMPIPADPTLRGVDIFTQLATLEPLAQRGFAFSAPVRLRLGD